MFVTEEEAKDKWCPFARSLDARTATTGSINRAVGGLGDLDPDCMCIGSRCMAWRAGVWDHQRNLKPEDRTPGVGYCGAFTLPIG